MSESTASTAAICSSRFGALASITCNSKSASAASALRRYRARDAGQAAAQELHTLRYQPAIGFELRLAGAAQSNAALLTLQVRPPAHQASRHMIQLRKLDLKLALGALCPLRE